MQRILPLACLTSVAILVFILYAPALDSDYLLDDLVLIQKDSLLTSPNGIISIWTAQEDSIGWPYIPLTRTSFWLERQIFGENLRVSHSINVILHIVTVGLLWLVFRRLKIPGAWVMVVCVAFHPIFVQSVVWLTQRRNLLAGIFYILTLWSFVEAERSGKKTTYLGAVVFFALAMLSKSSPVMLPVVLILVRYWQRLSWNALVWLRLIPFFAISIAFAAIRVWYEYNVFGVSRPEFDLNFADRLLIAIHVPFFYLQKLFAPYPLIFTYPKWSFEVISPSLLLPAISILIGGSLLLYKHQTWGRGVALGLGVFGVTLFPVMGFFDNAFHRFSYVSDHWVALPSLAIFFLVALAVSEISQSISKRIPRIQARVILPIALAIPLCGLTWNQVQDYRTQLSLWQATVEKNPQSWAGYSNLGLVYLAQQDYPKGIDALNRVTELRGPHAPSLALLGKAYHIQKQYAHAIQALDSAIQADPEHAPAYIYRAAILIEQQAYALALQSLNRGLELSQSIDYYRATVDLPHAYSLKGQAHLQLQQFPQALESFTQAIRLQPSNIGNHLGRAYALIQLNRLSEACETFQLVCQLGECQYWKNACS